MLEAIQLFQEFQLFVDGGRGHVEKLKNFRKAIKKVCDHHEFDNFKQNIFFKKKDFERK